MSRRGDKWTWLAWRRHKPGTDREAIYPPEAIALTHKEKLAPDECPVD